MQFSTFGQKFTEDVSILGLMDDLGKAMASGGQVMMGGGNPSHIPAVQTRFRERMSQILAEDHAFEALVGNYATPQGDPAFINALATLLQAEYGWDVRPENIVLTNGSQTTFFYLFNLLAGQFEGGQRKKILLPLAPEYIGYADTGLSDDLFVAAKPEIDFLDEHTFKYRVNFNALNLSDEIGAICVSRPTNPTGNVLTDDEIARLSELARQHDIPLILDNAYGLPFPGITFTEATPLWNDHTILCMSLSKLGLPGVRTGIVIAPEPMARAIASLNAIISLAPSSVGAALAVELVRSGEILEISRNIIRPYYRHRAEQAVEQLWESMTGLDFYIHKAEGAIFLWLWFKGLPISSQELYLRLKARGVLIVPGHHFYPGLSEAWQHKYECIRMTYSQDEAVVRAGIQIVAEEVKKAYQA